MLHAGSRTTVLIVFTLICTTRFIVWWRTRQLIPNPQMALKALARTIGYTVAITIGFTTWALVLFHYGDAYTQAHVALYMAITVIG